MYINSHSFISAAGENNFAGGGLQCVDGRWVGKVGDVLNVASEFRKDDRSVHLALHCAGMIELSAELSPNLVNLASSRGATLSLEQAMKDFLERGKVSPFTSPITTAGRLSSAVAQFLQVEGNVLDHSMTCSGGLQSILNAQEYLSSGRVEQAVVGASEACLSPFTFAQFDALNLYSKRKETPCLPLVEKEENTLVLGEGAAILVLSNLRGKNCDFRISGVGQGFERGAHAADLRGENIVQSMKQALLNANTPRVDAVIAHAPGTRLGDENELRAIHTVLGDLPVLSNKWMLGHTLAVSGLMNVFWAMELMKGWRPEIPKGLEEAHPIPEQLNTVLVNALGFGGNAISVVLERC